MSPEEKDTATVEETVPELGKKRMARVQKRKVKDDCPSDSIIDEVISISGSSPVPAKKAKTKKAADNASQTRLPEGWSRKTVVRKKGKTAGQIDVYFYAPNGTKLRSKPDVKSYLDKNKLQLKIEAFDFSKRLEEEESIVVSKKLSSKKIIKSNAVVKEGTSSVEDPKENGERSSKSNLDNDKKSAKKDKDASPRKVIKEVVQITAFKKKRTKK